MLFAKVDNVLIYCVDFLFSTFITYNVSNGSVIAANVIVFIELCLYGVRLFTVIFTRFAID